MKGMFLLSTFVHGALLASLLYWPEWTHKQAVYTPVYTVDLLTLPPAKKSPPHKKPAKKPLLKKKMPPQTVKRKRLSFTPPRQSEDLIKELERFEANIGKEKKREEVKKIKETALSDMLTAFEKKWGEGRPQKTAPESAAQVKEQEDLLKRLKRLEEKWDASHEDKKGKEGLAAREEPLAARLDKQIRLRQANLKSQTPAPRVSPLLNRYYALILSRIKEHWRDPLSTKIKEPRHNIPGVAYFEIMSTGAVNQVRIEESSGDELFDSLVKKAIEDSSPLPPPPRQLSEGGLKIFLDFNYVFAK